MMMAALAIFTGTVVNAQSSGCPSSNAIDNFLVAPNVSASFTNSGNVSSYTFTSLIDQDPVNGVPGLIRYCVYPTPESQPTSVNPTATGANGAAWDSDIGTDAFAFGRPTGNPSNIPFDGTGTAIGTATWSTLPTIQQIILHINDAETCDALYGGNPGTCFVRPTTVQPTPTPEPSPEPTPEPSPCPSATPTPNPCPTCK